MWPRGRAKWSHIARLGPRGRGPSGPVSAANKSGKATSFDAGVLQSAHAMSHLATVERPPATGTTTPVT